MWQKDIWSHGEDFSQLIVFLQNAAYMNSLKQTHRLT